jgi:GTP cyclohydrolase IA
VASEARAYNTIHRAFKQILSDLDPEPGRDGLRDTPHRVAVSMMELTAGYEGNPGEILKTFDSDGYHELVLQKDIPFYSLCEHHLLPFVGKAHIGYIPNGRIVGLSKLARLLEIFARRLQVQERLTAQVANALMDHLEPEGAIVVIEAEHFCMTMRGISKAGSRTTTSALRGLFLEDDKARSEALGLIRGG